VLREFTELVEPLAGAFAQDVSRLGAGFGCQQRNLSAVATLFSNICFAYSVFLAIRSSGETGCVRSRSSADMSSRL